MKYLIPILLAFVSISACGQTTSSGHPSYGAANNFAAGTLKLVDSCDPKTDRDKAHDRDLPIFSDDVRYCDAKSRQWTLDSEATKAAKARQKQYEDEYAKKVAHHKALAQALVLRVLTDAEYGEVLELGPDIYDEPLVFNCPQGCSVPNNYQEIEANQKYLTRKRFDDELLIQFKLRAIAAEHPRPTGNNCLAINTPEARACMGMLPTDPEPMGSYYCGSHDCSLPFPMPITGCPTGTSPVQHGGADQFECRPGSATSP